MSQDSLKGFRRQKGRLNTHYLFNESYKTTLLSLALLDSRCFKTPSEGNVSY